MTTEQNKAEHNKDVLRRFLAAMAAGDPEALGALLSEDAAWWVPLSASRDGFGRPLIGRQAIAQFAGGKVTKAFIPGSTRWEFEYEIAEGDLAAAKVRRIAVGSNGASYENEYIWLFRFNEDASVAEVWETMDTALAFRLLAIDSALPRKENA
ncbi:MAG TPA: nuclear transport factor 2 family protein [Jatrophihabitans sp.]|jgi:ketosteroid isomerase-like protein